MYAIRNIAWFNTQKLTMDQRALKLQITPKKEYIGYNN